MAQRTTMQMAIDALAPRTVQADGLSPLAPPQAARLRSLANQYFDSAWRSLRRLGVREPSVDDAVQQLFIVLAAKLDAIDPKRERAFVFGTAVRIAADCRRALERERERRSSRDSDAIIDTLPAPDELLNHKRARELLDRLLDTLPMELRSVLILAEGEGMTMSEIAGLCEIPQGTVASRLRRARAAVLQGLDGTQSAAELSRGRP